MYKIRIAETENFSEGVISKLKEIAMVDVIETEKTELKKCLEDYDVFWFRLKFKVEETDFPENNRCKYILCPVTGIDHIDLDACEKRGIKVLSLKGEKEFLKKVRATAEHTLALTLVLLRQVPQAIDSVKNFNWQRDLFKGNEIFEKKVGILGVGRLGKIAAQYFRALGAEVYGYDVVEFDDNICKKVNSIEELVSMVDILSIHANYEESTHHLINKTLFEKMKPTSVLINTSRGAVVDSDALLEALQSKTIKGAALDVIENEFDINQNKLIAYASQNYNLIITPHIGGNTWESFSKTEIFMVEKLKVELNLTKIQN
jgi:D-3-phosphoglycerate dehydrogenase